MCLKDIHTHKLHQHFHSNFHHEIHDRGCKTSSLHSCINIRTLWEYSCIVVLAHSLAEVCLRRTSWSSPSCSVVRSWDRRARSPIWSGTCSSGAPLESRRSVVHNTAWSEQLYIRCTVDKSALQSHSNNYYCNFGYKCSITLHLHTYNVCNN